MREYYRRLCDENCDYQLYKRTFQAVCNFMRLPANDVIIENLVLDKDKKDKDQDCIAVCYSKGHQKVKIPDGIRLIHVSPADDIKELQPSFRSKVQGRYLYPTKRCFFTVAREIRPKHAGLEKTKTTRYTPVEQFKEAWIDPTYATYRDGSVYIETNKPIPVEHYDRAMEKLMKTIRTSLSHDNKPVKESMLDEEQCQFVDEEVLAEVLDAAKDKVKSTADIIKSWKLSNEKDRIKNFKTTQLSQEEADEVDECIKTMRKEDVEYGEYKKAFTKFCRIIHVVPTGTIIRSIDFKRGKGDEKSSLEVTYADNTHTITLPDDIKLYHMTTVEGIEKLNPTFRGKTGYLYDKPRIYFTIHKKMPKFLADYDPKTKLHTYECKKDIKEVYVDPLVPSNLQGAVYIETQTPVPVEEVGIKKK